MSEVYMTAYQLNNVSKFIESLNTLNKDAYLYDMTIDLTGDVRDDDGRVLGKITFSVDEDAYVYVPLGFEAYNPTDRGE